jgi:enoyl-CoA hydratase/carnithine racemase
VEEDGKIALVTFNRPDKLNSMGGSMMSDLVHYLRTLELTRNSAELTITKSYKEVP